MSELYTVKQFAAADGVSTQSIYSRMKGDLEKYVVVQGNLKYIDIEHYRTEHPESGAPVCGDSGESADGAEDEPEIARREDKLRAELDGAVAAVSALRRELERADEMIAIFKEQIAIKDKQIAVMQQNLSDALELNRNNQVLLLSTQGHIAALPKDEDCTEEGEGRVATPSDEHDGVEKTVHKKTGLLERLFGKH